jgi:ribose 5-phosphate isomerase B
MSEISEGELHQIVQKALEEAAGRSCPLAVIPSPLTSTPANPSVIPQQKMVAIGSDHGGFGMKEALKSHLVELGFGVLDCGTFSTEAVDYPDFTLAVAQAVAGGKAWRGIMIDGAGIGSCMAANKVPGIRAAMCYDISTASNSREHNDANLLTLGAGMIGENLAKQIIKTWLTTDFGGGRHQKRVDKIVSIEKQFLKDGK